jgi:RNA polymerase sigma factor (sigma-70 family)
VDVGDSVSEPPDRELVQALAIGGAVRQRAWSVLVSRHSRRLYVVARSFGLDAATAEDLVQTAWLRLIERAHQLRDPDAVGAWLAMIVRNEARRVVTRRREVPTDTTIDRGELVESGADNRLLQSERALALRAAFARLGQDCQQLLRLVMAEPPLSYDEIAIAVGRPRGSLGPTRRRCLEQLRTHLPAGFEP